MIQLIKRQNCHQIPFTIGETGTIQMTARLTAFQNNGVIFAFIHRCCHLINIIFRFLILTVKDLIKPVKIIFVCTALVPNHIASVFAYHIGINHRTVRFQKKDLTHILRRKPCNNRKAIAAVGHRIFTGNAEQNHIIPAAVHCGGCFSLPLF